MRVLVAHNAYQQRGGEDAVADSEVAMLRQFGHEVECLTRHNDELKGVNPLKAAVQTLWSAPAHAQMQQVIRRFAPDVVHVHNTFPMLSPSIYWACAKANVPVVQTLHNFRLACPQAMLLRDGKPCEACLGSTPWPAVRHGCYRDSRAASAVLGSMLVLHRGLGTWRDKIKVYIALSEFARSKFIQAGLPEDKLVVKPNFVDAGAPSVQEKTGQLFVGRLSEEKGVAVLAQACKQLAPGMVTTVIGAGPQAQAFSGLAGLHLLGALPAAQVMQQMASTQALLIPSICYESFPRTLVEAYACGVPVLASRIGALAELVVDGQTGIHVNPGDAQDLANKMIWARNHPAEMAQMGQRARQLYEQKYTPQHNHAMLQAIYQRAVGS
jgi:glycosyltransferase involved in cell wall biosynthesis